MLITSNNNRSSPVIQPCCAAIEYDWHPSLSQMHFRNLSASDPICTLWTECSTWSKIDCVLIQPVYLKQKITFYRAMLADIHNADCPASVHPSVTPRHCVKTVQHIDEEMVSSLIVPSLESSQHWKMHIYEVWPSITCGCAISRYRNLLDNINNRCILQTVHSYYGMLIGNRIYRIAPLLQISDLEWPI